MITRRGFARHLGGLATAGPFLGEGFLAMRARSAVVHRADAVWLDANENPEGPPSSAIEAITRGAAATARYHFDEFGAFTEALARSEGLKPEQVIFGIGSSDVIDAAICAFTSASHPMISVAPTFEIPVELARSMGRKIVQVPLTEPWSYPVKRLAEEAAQAGGGLIYMCNPNNPTASLTPKADIAWLVTNLPPNTVLLIDEAYIQFAEPTQVESAISFVRRDRNVVVTRTFSKIYGMAGARAGFACARPDLIRSMAQFKDNIIPILGLRAAMAALGDAATLIPRRRANVARIRGELCGWLRQKNLRYIEPHANFVMIDIGRDVRTFGGAMFQKGVAVGRPFPPLNGMLRVTVGTDAEMARFREAFWQVYSA
jgi:histidinol-phosphate aminotransferase